MTLRTKHDLSSSHTGAIEPLVLSRRTGGGIRNRAHGLPKLKQFHRASYYHRNWETKQKKVWRPFHTHLFTPFIFTKWSAEIEISLAQLSAWQSEKTMFSSLPAAQDCDLPEILSFYLHVEEICFLVHALSKGIDLVCYYSKRNQPTIHQHSSTTGLCYLLLCILCRTDSIICTSLLLCSYWFVREHPDFAPKWQCGAKLSWDLNFYWRMSTVCWISPRKLIEAEDYYNPQD